MNLKAKLAFLKGIVARRSPIYVQFAVSKYCNLKCSMCQAVESRKSERELGLEEIKRLSEILCRLGSGIVVLTGGEPLLRRDLEKIVAVFTSNGLEVRLQTNGLLASEERIKALLDAGLKEVTLSLDTLDADKQDAINNQRGSWDKTIRALALFSRILPKRGNMTGVNTVVSKMNIAEIPAIIRFVTGIGFYSSLIPVHLSCGQDDFIVRSGAQDFRFSQDDHALIDSAYREAIGMKKKGYHVHNSFRFLRESPDFLKYGKTKWRCDSPDLYFSVSPQGYFLPCVDLKGDKSMLDADFIEVFNGRDFRAGIRETVRKCQGCFYACYPEVSYFCRDPRTTFERIRQGIAISRTVRSPLGYEDSLRLIERIKKDGLCRPR